MASQENDETVDVAILRKYKLQAKLGKGAYGVVWQATNKKTKQVVALKKIFGAFQNKTDAQRTFREVVLLQEFQHDNIIRLLEVSRAMNDRDLYLVFEFMEADLHETIRAGVLTDAHNQYIMYQLLKAINYMHKARVLHRDLKPGNVLINSDCQLKVCDLGLARLFTPKKAGDGHSMMTMREADFEKEQEEHDPNNAALQPMTENIATRWYCAPEILVGSSNYSTGVDIWAIGCILGELLAKKTIFPGDNTIHQLELIVQVTGPPTRSDIESMQCPSARSLLLNLKPSRSVNLEKRLRNAPPEALDLLRNLLVFNPEKRLSCREAMQHPWLKNFLDERDLDPVVPDIKMIDQQSPTAAHYRKQLYAHIDKQAEALAAREEQIAQERKNKRELKKKEKANPKRSSKEVTSYQEVAKQGGESPAVRQKEKEKEKEREREREKEQKEKEKEKEKENGEEKPQKKKSGFRLPFVPRKGVAKKKKEAAASAAPVPAAPVVAPTDASTSGSPTVERVVSEPIRVKKVGHIGVDGSGNFNYSSLPKELLDALGQNQGTDKDSLSVNPKRNLAQSTPPMGRQVSNRSKRISMMIFGKKEEKEKMPRSRSFGDINDSQDVAKE